ncbi:ladderlectin-like [Lycodopsis pacificus]
MHVDWHLHHLIAFAMKTLTVSALVCAMIALTQALSQRRVYCAQGWTECSGRCFRYIPKPMTWAEAERVERIQTVSDSQYRVTVLDSQLSFEKHMTQEKKWFWSDVLLSATVNWCHGEPNNAGGRQHCLQMNYGAQKCWDDVQCSYNKPSVCVKRG